MVARPYSIFVCLLCFFFLQDISSAMDSSHDIPLDKKAIRPLTLSRPDKPLDVSELQGKLQEAIGRCAAAKDSSRPRTAKKRASDESVRQMAQAVDKRALLVSSLKASVPDLQVTFDQTNGSVVCVKARNLLTGHIMENPSMRGGGDVPTETAKDRAVRCLDTYRDLLRIQDARQEFTERYTLTDGGNRNHIRWQQRYQGLPIWGKELWVHVDAQRQPYMLEGHVQPTPSLSIQPRLSQEQAIDIAEKRVGVLTNRSVELQIHVGELGIARLVYHVIGIVGTDRWHCMVDANNGYIAEQFNDTRYAAAEASGIDLAGVRRYFSAWWDGDYYLTKDTSLPMHVSDPTLQSIGIGNVLVYDVSRQLYPRSFYTTTGWDSSAVSLVHNLRTVYGYYRNTFGRESLDDHKMSIIGMVHVTDPNSGNDTASWDHRCLNFGDGENYFTPLAGSLDVVAHEYTHGVVQYTAQLAYHHQCGALNEGLADIFACMVDREDWRIGEDVTMVFPFFLRSVSDPHQQGIGESSPETMDEYQALPYSDDNGGVHINSTIISHAAYLMAEGLKAKQFGSSLGRAKTEQIFYKAMRDHLVAESNFADCRRATIASAEELYGHDGIEVSVVEKAWDTVKVFDGAGAGNGTTIPEAVGRDVLLFLSEEDGQCWLKIRDVDGRAYYVSQFPVLPARPVVIQNGTTVLFVNARNDFAVASLLPDDDYEDVLDTGGVIRTIAGSRDER